MMEKIGELNAWEAATRAQSCSRHSGCINTKYPHCLSNCLVQSKHNLLSTSLQLKCIYVCTVNTLFGMRHYAGTWSSLSFTFLISKHSIHFLFSQQRVPTNHFFPGPETCLYHLATKRRGHHHWDQRHWELSLGTPVVKQPILHEGSVAEGWKAKHLTLFSNEKYLHL